MKAIALSIYTASHLLLAINLAHAACGPSLNEQLASAESLVDSLRPDKPGQPRVTGSDGSEYTAGQSQWLKGRIRFARRACERRDEASAADALRSISELLHTRHRE